MKNEFFELLEQENKSINEEKASVSFNPHSIDIMEILEDGSNGYGNTFYSVYEAMDYLKSLDALD